jgi:oxygen-dependent protoporphyrinogen oxidase
LKRRNTSGGPKGRMFSFPNGLVEVPDTLALILGNAVRLQTEVKSIRRTENGWTIDCADRNRSWTEEFAAVVCALPADALASLRVEGVTEAWRLADLRRIEHPPVTSVFTGFARDAVRHPLDGFGALMPQVEHGSILGTLFSSSLFPGRAPEDHVAFTTFVGGSRQPELARLGDGEILRMVQAELGRLLGVSAPPVFVHIQRWSRAIPQYAIGYQHFKDIMTKIEASAPGFFIGGNSRDGISLANCLASGRHLADNVRCFLAANPLTTQSIAACN